MKTQKMKLSTITLNSFVTTMSTQDQKTIFGMEELIAEGTIAGANKPFVLVTQTCPNGGSQRVDSCGVWRCSGCPNPAPRIETHITTLSLA